MKPITLESKLVTSKNGVCMFRIRFEKSDGTTVEKTVSLEDYVSIIRNASVEVQKEEYYSLTNLPENVYSVAATGSKDTFRVTMFVPGKVRGVTFCNSFIYRVPYPNLVMKICVVKGKMVGSQIFAVKDDTLSPDTELYQYPFGNVDTSGLACWGSIDRTCKRVEEVPNLIERFFEAGTNNHYYEAGVTISKNLSLSEQYTKLERLKKYPDNYLVSTGRKLKDITTE